jgi:hypothetical protein
MTRQQPTAMLDEASVATILSRHFPRAASAEINDAARDVLLLELLADDRIPVWEDCLHDRIDPASVSIFAMTPRRES